MKQNPFSEEFLADLEGDAVVMAGSPRAMSRARDINEPFPGPEELSEAHFRVLARERPTLLIHWMNTVLPTRPDLLSVAAEAEGTHPTRSAGRRRLGPAAPPRETLRAGRSRLRPDPAPRVFARRT